MCISHSNRSFRFFPGSFQDQQAYACAVAEQAKTIDQQTFEGMNKLKATIVTHINNRVVKETLHKAEYASTKFFVLAQRNPKATFALSSFIVLCTLRASTWRRSLFSIGAVVAGILFAYRGYKYDQDLGPLSQVLQSLKLINAAIHNRALVVDQMEKELWTALNDWQVPPEKLQENLILLVTQMDGKRSNFIDKFIARLSEKAERVLSDPVSFTNHDRYSALCTIYDTLGCRLLFENLAATKKVYDEYDQWVDIRDEKKAELFERMMEHPSRFADLLNQILPEMWRSPLMQPYEYRIKNTELLMRYPTLFETELDQRRKAVFDLASRLPDIGISFDYVVKMLTLLKPVHPVGCMMQLARVKEFYIKVLDDPNQRKNYKSEQLVEKGVSLGFDRAKLEELLKSPFVNFLKTFKRQGTRINEFSAKASVEISGELRDGGHATPIEKVPKIKDLNRLTLAAAAFNVAPRPIEDCSEEINLMVLIDHLHRADQLGLVPDPLVESLSIDTHKNRDKKTVLNDLGVFLNEINHPKGLNQRLSEVRRILRLYAFQFCQRAQVDMSADAEREIYGELVTLIAMEIGFATYHCEDRQLNAAMMIYREKIKREGLKDESIPQKVQQWAAKQRDSLFSQVVYEMILEVSARSGVGYDVASRIGYWRYIMRDELALGDVPSPAHNLDAANQILDIDSIRIRFKNTYTVKWLFEKARDEHKLEEAQRKNNANLTPTSELSSSTIYNYLSSVISNFDEICDELFHEENYTLLDRGLALFLQETGLIKRTI